jgi:hypothetical protein
MKERLDRVTANSAWCDRFREVDVVVGAALSSDHSPIFVNLLGDNHSARQPKRFRHEEF